MKIQVDASIMVEGLTAYGRLSGTLTLAAVPAPDALISFQFPPRENVSPPSGFIGQLRVRKIIFQPGNGSDAEVLAMLEDLILHSMEEAKNVADYLARGFGLQVEEYE